MRNLFRNKRLFLFPFNLQVFTQTNKWVHGVLKLSGIAVSPFHTDEMERTQSESSSVFELVTGNDLDGVEPTRFLSARKTRSYVVYVL